MENNTQRKGSVESFDKNWKEQEESFYNHWTPKAIPSNQIQLAFKEHYRLFNKLIFNPKEKLKILEVGCGRGSLSSYFSQAGHDCTLLDISSEVINIAQNIFSKNGLNASFVVGDAENLQFKKEEFDLIFSIGLLEHFENIEKTIGEQIRVLKKGGTFIGYVVPENLNNIQKDYYWINDLLKKNISKTEMKRVQKKEGLFRSDAGSYKYVKACKSFGLDNIQALGTYPLPMISHSIDFPFTIMDQESEKILVNRFLSILKERESFDFKDRWLCEESYGQAFLVWGKK